MTPQQIGPYRLDGLLGRGGMGVVYRAHDTMRVRDVALKLLPEAFSRDEEFKGRFRRESRVAARLREPHIIPIHDFGEIDEQLFIDMRLVDGRELSEILAKDGRLTPERSVGLITQVADALDAAHSEGLVHRDIKPSNVLVTAHDFVYVVDFGIARSIGSARTSLTISGATIGTLDYMSPERFTRAEIDGRADVYSLACVLFECLTRTRPFPGRDLPTLMFAHLHTDPPLLSSVVPGLPADLDAVITKGMAKNPDDRFATAGAFAAAADTALRSAASVQNPRLLPTVRVEPPVTAAASPPTAPPYTALQAATPQPAVRVSDDRDAGKSKSGRYRGVLVALAVFAVLVVGAATVLVLQNAGSGQLAGEGRLAQPVASTSMSPAKSPAETAGSSRPPASSGSAPPSTSASISPAAAAIETADPGTTPAPPAEPAAVVPPAPTPAEIGEQQIRAVIPAGLQGCAPTAPTAGGVAAISCQAAEVTVGYEAFADRGATDAAFNAKAGEVGAQAGTCGQNESSWSGPYHRSDHHQAAGRVLCFQPADGARLVWTQDDQPTILTSAVYPGSGDVHHPLYENWESDAYGPQSPIGAVVERGGCTTGEC